MPVIIAGEANPRASPGEPRFTRGVDCTVPTGLGDEAFYVDGLLAFTARIPDARTFALTNRVLLALAFDPCS